MATKKNGNRYSKFTKQVGRTVVDGIERMQTSQVDAVKRARKTVERYTKRFPETPRPAFATGLPTARQLCKANFDLVEDIYEAQKSYTYGLIDAFTKTKKAKKQATAHK